MSDEVDEITVLQGMTELSRIARVYHFFPLEFQRYDSRRLNLKHRYPSIDLVPILHPFRQQMRYIAAYNLAVLGGNSQPTSGDVSKILKSAGITIDAAAIDKLVAELSGKDMNAIVADGMKKMASIPAGVAAPAASTSSASATAAPAAAESKKEAAKPAKEESDEEMGFGLFD